MAQRRKGIGAIQELVRACRESQEAFRQAADHAQDPELRSFLQDQVEERDLFARELEGGPRRPRVPARGSMEGAATGTLGRAWLGLKAALNTGDQSILSSLVAGEESTRNAYEGALQQGLAPGVASTVRTQLQSIVAADEVLKLMRERRRAA